jgi:hypothetical protein
MATNAVYGVAAYGSSQYGTLFVTADAGSYTLTGGAATFKRDLVVQGAAGSFALTGVAASLLASRLLTADAGAYALTGYSSTLIHDDVIYAGAFAFHYTGNDAGLITDRILTSDAGAYSITGGAADLLKALVITGDAGSYALTGVTADLQSHPVVTEFVTTGGLPKKVKTKVKKSQRDEVEAIVREAFDKMDGTYVPPEVVAEIQQDVKREIKQIDLSEHDYAIGQINALLLQARMTLQEYEANLDDEESLLMLI